MGLCQFCGCEEAYNFHHFIPRTVHSNRWFKKNFTREEMRVGIHVCKQCHRTIHELIPDEKELGKHFNSLSKLAAHPKIDGYLQWKRRKFRIAAQGTGAK